MYNFFYQSKQNKINIFNHTIGSISDSLFSMLDENTMLASMSAFLSQKKDNNILSKQANSLEQYWANEVSQQDYTKLKGFAIYHTMKFIDALKQEQLPSFDKTLLIIQFMGTLRQSMAQSLGQKDNTAKFGKLRSVYQNTDDYYAQLRQRIKEHKNRSCVSIGSFCLNTVIGGEIYQSFFEELLQRFDSLSEKHKSEKFGNHTYHYLHGFKDKINEFDSKGQLIKTYDNELKIIHPLGFQDVFNAFIIKLAESFGNFLTTESNENEIIISRVAEISYFFTLLMPFERGSAASAEILRAALFLSKNLDLDFQDEIPLDLSAYFSTNLEDFTEYFNDHLVALAEMQSSYILPEALINAYREEQIQVAQSGWSCQIL